MDVRLAARLLIAVGVVILVPGGCTALVFGPAWMAERADPCTGGFPCGLAEDLVVMGIAWGAIGGVHVLAGVGAMERQAWGRWLALILAAIGSLISAWALLSGAQPGAWWAVPLVVYGVSLVGLRRWQG